MLKQLALILILLASPAFAQSPVIHVPDAPSPAPAPLPPNTPVKIRTNVYYVIDSDVACMVLSSPASLVTITPDTGPLRIRGQFVDGTGTETRTYSRKFLYFVDPAGTGLAELLVIPAGTMDPQNVIRRALDVDNGQPPNPTPNPPGPTPAPTDAFFTALSAAWTADTGATKAADRDALAFLFSEISSGIVADTTLKTVGDAFTQLHGAIDNLIKTRMAGEHRAIADYLDTVLPRTQSTMLDATIRATMAKEAAKVSSYLKRLQ